MIMIIDPVLLALVKTAIIQHVKILDTWKIESGLSNYILSIVYTFRQK